MDCQQRVIILYGWPPGDPLKEIEWRTPHLLFNCIVEYLINIHFEEIFFGISKINNY